MFNQFPDRPLLAMIGTLLFAPVGQGSAALRFELTATYWHFLLLVWLLIGVFSFFGLHTVLWLYRSLRSRAGRN